MVVQGEDNLSGVLELLNQGVGWEELFPEEEKKFSRGQNCTFLWWSVHLL